MNRETILAHLDEWQDAMRTCDAHMGALADLLDASPESKLFTAVAGMQGLLTRQVAELCCITLDWLEAWWIEHDFGATAMHAGLKDEPLREISTLEELVDLICDDEEAALRDRVATQGAWQTVIAAVAREIPRYRFPSAGNAPGHVHQVPGVWDSDNGELAGQECAWCAAWNTAICMLGDAVEARK